MRRSSPLFPTRAQFVHGPHLLGQAYSRLRTTGPEICSPIYRHVFYDGPHLPSPSNLNLDRITNNGVQVRARSMCRAQRVIFGERFDLVTNP